MGIDSKNSPLTKGCQAKPDGVLKLPYNPNLKQKARELRKAGVLSEVLLWKELKNKKMLGFDFTRQQIIGNYIVDFYCPKLQLIIEIDGESHNFKGKYDVKRDEYLITLGLNILHFNDLDIKKSINEVIFQIKSWIRINTPSAYANASADTPFIKRGIIFIFLFLPCLYAQQPQDTTIVVPSSPSAAGSVELSTAAIGRSVEISTPTVSGTVDISTPTLSETIEPSTPTITETPPPQQQKLTEETKPVAPEPAAPKLDIEKIFRVTESISQAESNGPGAVDTWINLLYQPMDINKVTVDDLMSIPSVTPIDAYNVVKTRRKKGAFFSIDEIGSVPNISRYGNYSIRDYCVVQEKERVTQLSGVYRFSWTGVRYYGRISDEDEVPSLSQGNYAVFPVHKIQIRYGENVFAGAMSSEVFFKEKNQNDTSKVYAGVRNLPLLGGKFNIDRLYFGNYYLSLGQGLIMENSNDFSPRRYQRVQGIFGDISAGTIGSDSLDSGSFSGLYKLTGMAFQTTISKRLQIIYFYASDKRDGIMNPDGTINYYFSDVIRKDSIKNKFNENIAGYNFRLNILGEAGYVGITKFTSQTDKAFNSDPNFLAAYNRADFLTATVPEYNGLYKGNSREISGYDFRTVFQNFAFSGEFANQKDGGSASILRFDAQIRGFALTGLWRDYATNYDNPFNRAFAEYSKFNDSILEKDYDLFDEYYAALPAAVPQPKGEKGLYMKIYLPLTRNLTINRLEYDNWQQYEYDSRTDRTNLARSYRKDAEIAYRLSRGVRISLREKQYSMDPDNQDDLTTESQVRLRVTRYPKSFQLKYFYRNKSYRVSPQDRYTHTREAGSYVSGDVTHYLTSTISLTARLLLWNTSPGSWLWDIEDTLPFDYMNRTGMKYYLIIKDQVADNLSIRIKFRNKITYKEYAVEPNALTYGKYYMYDIQNSRDNIYDFKFQIDYSF